MTRTTSILRTGALAAAVTLLAIFAAGGAGKAGDLASLRAPAGGGPRAPVDVEELVALPATVESIGFTKRLLSYRVLDGTGAEIGTTTWRVVRGTGNCCENHLGATASGRLIDFGGNYLLFSDDQGQTWKRVRPAEVHIGAEGTVVQAPNGDILGVTWDPYTGDRVISFKMTAATGKWEYMHVPLHTPFYDREWIGVIPGPITVGGQTVPYLTVIRGGAPSKDVWFYSLDGLNYTLASNKALTAIAGETQEWLPTQAAAWADWTQPIAEMGMTPLVSGGALAWRVDGLDSLTGRGWFHMKPGAPVWTRFTLADGTPLPEGRLAQDSRGWTHLIDTDEGTITYRLSKDGGRTWTTTTTTLPAGHRVEDWDFRANGALGITAVGIHAHNDVTDKDQDLVLKYATGCGAPELVRTYFVGKGDLNAGSGVLANTRFDFATTVLLPDGRVATSLQDSQHTAPTLAVEVSTTLNEGYTPPPLSCGVPAP